MQTRASGEPRGVRAGSVSPEDGLTAFQKHEARERCHYYARSRDQKVSSDERG